MDNVLHLAKVSYFRSVSEVTTNQHLFHEAKSSNEAEHRERKLLTFDTGQLYSLHRIRSPLLEDTNGPSQACQTPEGRCLLEKDRASITFLINPCHSHRMLPYP